MIVFQTHGNNITNVNNEIKINETVIKLTKIRKKSNGNYICLFFMGKEDSQ